MAKDFFPQSKYSISDIEDCVNYFHNKVSPTTKKLLGVEYELILVDKLSTLSVSYFGERGLSSILTKLLAYNFNAVFDEGCIVGLEKNGMFVSLEPGGQLEFSTSPTSSAGETYTQIEDFLRILHPICERLGIAILPVGYRPFGSPDSVKTVPRSRYITLLPHLEKTSPLSNEQKMTASIQVSLDYHSQMHAGKSLLLASKCQPFVVALFSNSPINNGSISGFKSYRMYTWSNFCPDRCGIPSFVHSPDFIENAFEYYTQWALNKRVLFITRGHQIVSIDDITFLDFLSQGYLSYTPDIHDWVSHLGTLFPEARLKNVLEMRSADTCDPKLASGLAAFWKGLIYDDTALDEALEYLSIFTEGDTVSLYYTAFKHGMDGTAPNGKLFPAVLMALLNIAKEGLTRLQTDDIHELQYLIDIVISGTYPADSTIHKFSHNALFTTAMSKPEHTIHDLQI